MSQGGRLGEGTQDSNMYACMRLARWHGIGRHSTAHIVAIMTAWELAPCRLTCFFRVKCRRAMYSAGHCYHWRLN